MPKKGLGPNFKIKNKLLTFRYWSYQYTTSLFDPSVKNYTLMCQFPLKNFNLDMLKNPVGVQLYITIGKTLYISRIGGFQATVDPESITLKVILINLYPKASWDMEFATPDKMYEDILTNKQFFKFGGKDLESYIRPLGLLRKDSETDRALRRRTLEYLRFKLASEPDEVLSEEEIRKLHGEENAQ